MGHVELHSVGVVLPDGRPLLHDVAFRVGEGTRTPLVGTDGAVRTTLLRVVAGDAEPVDGRVSRGGGLGVLRQFVGSVHDDTSVRDLLLADPGPPTAGCASAGAAPGCVP